MLTPALNIWGVVKIITPNKKFLNLSRRDPSLARRNRTIDFNKRTKKKADTPTTYNLMIYPDVIILGYRYLKRTKEFTEVIAPKDNINIKIHKIGLFAFSTL